MGYALRSLAGPARSKLGGGGWGQAQPERFKLYGQGAMPEQSSGSFGFRLVLTEER